MRLVKYSQIILTIVFSLLCMSAIARDPTQPPNVQAAAEDPLLQGDNSGSLTVSGVLITKNNRIAMINNGTYKVGDKIQDLTIVAITNDYVKFKNDATTFEMPIRITSSPNINIQKTPTHPLRYKNHWSDQ